MRGDRPFGESDRAREGTGSLWTAPPRRWPWPSVFAFSPLQERGRRLGPFVCLMSRTGGRRAATVSNFHADITGSFTGVHLASV
jgi:hypothetical protein